MRAMFFAVILAASTAWADKPFHAKGKYYETCACAVSCPCATNQFLPTEGHCDAVMAFHFDKAAVGKVKLDGLNLAVVMKSPKDQKVVDAFAKGDMDHFAIYIDEKANDAQRAAFPELMQGMFGKMEIKNAKAPAFVPITLEGDKETQKIDVDGGRLTADIVNIKIGETQRAGKTVPKHIKMEGVVPFPWVKNVTQGKSNSFHYEDGDTKWDYKDRNAFFGEFATKGKVAMAPKAGEKKEEPE